MTLSTDVKCAAAVVAALCAALVLTACGGADAPSPSTPAPAVVTSVEPSTAVVERTFETATSEPTTVAAASVDAGVWLAELRSVKAFPDRRFAPTWGEAVDGSLSTALGDALSALRGVS